MKPNPGGQLDPDEILGRDALIADLWDVLEQRNVYMNDLRRIGKTMILNKMKAAPPDGWLVSKRDLGGLRSGAEFATRVFRDALELFGKKKRSLRQMGEWLGNLGGLHVGGILQLPDGKRAPWKEVLTRTFADIHEEHADAGERVLFLWDEVPFMLDNIRTDEGDERAMEVLDTIRSLCQDYPSIRLVLTGSVGIHHMLTQLRKVGYNNSPLNTFERVSPGPLDHDDAIELAARLIEGAGLEVVDRSEAAESLATSTGDVAFYIHRLISRMPKGEVDAEAIDRCLTRELPDADNDWDLDHYRTRLAKYYPDDNDEEIALAVLDSLAVSPDPIPFKELARQVRSKVTTEDEKIRSVLKLLLKDHYLERDEQGRYAFRLEIIRRWWFLDRGL